MVAWTLLIVGGLNWGLFGLMQLNLVDSLLGQYPPLDRLVYLLVGLAALYELLTHKANCRMCGK